MICLAANTATSILSLAICRDGETLFSFATPETRDQGNYLIKNIQQGLEKNGLTYADINLLAAVTGPGSFTGIRIGLAAMRGIALAANIPLVGISSFDMFAEKKEGSRNIVAIEAWRDELYFRLEGNDPCNLTPEAFAATLLQDETYFVSGDAADKIFPFLQTARKTSFTPDAVHVAALACAGGAIVEKDPLPFYLREADVTIAKVKV